MREAAPTYNKLNPEAESAQVFTHRTCVCKAANTGSIQRPLKHTAHECIYADPDEDTQTM